MQRELVISIIEEIYRCEDESNIYISSDAKTVDCLMKTVVKVDNEGGDFNINWSAGTQPG